MWNFKASALDGAFPSWKSVLSRRGLSQRKGSDLPPHWSELQIKASLDTLGTLKGCGFEGGISISSLLSHPLPARKIKVDSAEELLKEKSNRRNNNLLKVSKFPSKDPNQPLTEVWGFSRWKGSMWDLILREYQLQKVGFREVSSFQRDFFWKRADSCLACVYPSSEGLEKGCRAHSLSSLFWDIWGSLWQL